MSDMITFNASQLQIIKSTVARDTNQSEFNLFMEACKSYGLDPFRKQIHAVVYSKDKPDKRKMTIIVSRDGLRVLAHRCRDYRPASETAVIIYDKEIVGPTNPKGIVSATIKLWKQDSRSEWYPVIGEAYWDEYAPVADEWGDDEQSGRRKPTGKKTLDASGNWAKMPIVMITKCAESQALRAGWPETFGSVYAEEEMDRVSVNVAASEAMETHERAEREARTGGRGLLLVFDDAMKLEKVPMGSVADRVLSFIQSGDPIEVHKFRVRNEDALREFWAAQPSDAMALKKAFEASSAKIKTGEAA
jgi:phage recombination protein Bet